MFPLPGRGKSPVGLSHLSVAPHKIHYKTNKKGVFKYVWM